VSDPHATIEELDGIVTVTIDRQSKRNAISPEVTETFWQATRMLSERDELRCMVITARGEYFTAGIDLRSAPSFDFANDPHAAAKFRRYYRRHHLLYDEIEAVEKPVILAAQGICLGAGFEMALSCDFRFCSTRAAWELPEVKIGLIPGSNGTTRLTRIVGPHWAKYLAMAGKRISAAKAEAIGLVHEVFEEQHMLESVYSFCRELMAIPAGTLGVAKLAVDMAADVQDRTVQRNLDRLANTSLIAAGEFTKRIERFRKS
jgi:enoyl-CoA hydratase/carnithine racemase